MEVLRFVIPNFLQTNLVERFSLKATGEVRTRITIFSCLR